MINLPKTTILSYDEETQAAIVYPITDGKCTVFFVSYGENGKLNNIDLVENTFEAGIYACISQNNVNFTLGKGDKIMVLKDVTALSPVCETFIIE